MNEKDRATFLQTSAEKYTRLITIRSMVQAIPYVGGSLDTLLAGHGVKIQEKRIENFLQDLDQRLRLIEGEKAIEASEELFDLMLNAFDGVIKSRSAEKRIRFAAVIANQIFGKRQWEEADSALRLVNEMTDMHIAVLNVALSAPLCSKPFESLRVVTLKDKPWEGQDGAAKGLLLVEALPTYTKIGLRMACSDLVARGLLHDEGIGRWDGKSLEYFIATDLAQWFFEWIQGNDSNVHGAV